MAGETTEPTFEQQTSSFVTLDGGDPGSPAQDDAPAPYPTDDSVAPPAQDGSAPPSPPTDDDDAPVDGSSEQEPQRPAKGTAARRIQDLLESKRLADERTRDLERRLAAIEARGLTDAKPDTTVKDSDAPPKPEDFEYGELDSRYIDAKVEHRVKQALKADREEAKQAEQKTAAEQQNTELLKKAKAFETAGAGKFDDFNEVVIERARNGEFPVSRTIAELVFDSEHGPEIAYHLASNPKEAQEVAGLSAPKQAAYFGRLEAKFSSVSSDAARGQTAQVRTTQAPPPPKTSVRGGGSKTGFDPNTASFEQFEAHVRQAK